MLLYMNCITQSLSIRWVINENRKENRIVKTRQKFRLLVSITFILMLILSQVKQSACALAVAGSDSDKDTSTRIAYASTTPTIALTPGAKEAATLLGIMPKIDRLIQLRQTREARGEEMISDDELALRVEVLDKVMSGCLEVRMVSDRIDRELSWSFASQGMLQAKRQRILNYLFTANFMQSGILGTISGPMFLHGKPVVGTELLLLASSIGLGLSTASFVETRSGSKKIDGETTVLAHIFELPMTEPPHRFDTVVKFMTSVPPGSTTNKTRRQELIEGWKRGHYLRSTSEKNLEKLSALQPAAQKYKENISLISRRIRMLFDAQWSVQQLDGEMLDLLRATDIN
jgi:hypothetical protein